MGPIQNVKQEYKQETGIRGKSIQGNTGTQKRKIQAHKKEKYMYIKIEIQIFKKEMFKVRSEDIKAGKRGKRRKSIQRKFFSHF